MLSLYKTFCSGAVTREERKIIINIVRLLRRLLHGEEADVKLFDYVFGVLSSIEPNQDPEVVERIIAVNILYLLGYISKESSLSEVIQAETLKKAIENSNTISLAQFDTNISKALESSHL